MTMNDLKDAYYIMDTETQKLYQGETEYIPWIIHAFTDDLHSALRLTKAEFAAQFIKAFEGVKFEYDGNTPLRKGRLAVVKLALIPQITTAD